MTTAAGRRLGELVPAGITVPGAASDLAVRGLTADSRAAAPGFLFAALSGARTDGARFVADAVGRGAVAVLAGRDAALPEPLGVPVLLADDPRAALAAIAARFYPRQPDHLVAVTGTSGKTSVAVFARQIFAHAGKAAASIGTIGVVSPAGSDYGALTTPDPVTLHQTLDRLAREGVTHAALEASSHGLDQHRLDGVRLAAAGFTNLGRDHMDYHPTVEHYLAAKLRLFRDLLPEGGVAVADVDGPYGASVREVALRRGQTFIDIGRAAAAIRIAAVRPDASGQTIEIDGAYGRHVVALPLAGTFQVSNALVAAGLAIGAGIDADSAFAALGQLVGAPGRLERVGAIGGALVFVDYAHKPDAIEQALAALRPMTRGRLIVVFGAGGDRDPGKRPLMGAAAVRAADVVIVTDDNPRSEEPAAIRAAILAAAPGAIEIADRGAAIRTAIAMLAPGDVLCIAGKGHETGQIVNGVVHPFSDHAVTLAAIAEREAA